MVIENQKIHQLDSEIDNVQKSTRTLIPFLSPLHNRLRMSSPTYYHWHLYSFVYWVHWLIFILASVILVVIILALLVYSLF